MAYHSKLQTSHRELNQVGTCRVCGKQCYASRKAAKRAIKIMYPGDGGMNAYQCGNYWHIGHLPRHVKKGQDTRWRS